MSGTGLFGPRAVDGGAGDAHDAPGADRRGGVEHVARALDVDPRHERDVGHRVDDTGEVHDDVDALEQRLQLGAGDVDAGEFDRARAPFGLAHVESEHPIDVGMGGEHREEMAAHESGGAGDRDGMHPHTLTAWPIRLNLETPKSPTNARRPDVPGLPPFLFGGSVAWRRRLRPGQRSTSRRSTSRQVMRMLQSDGPVNWEVARQIAEQVALEGRTEPPVAPADRTQFEELAHAAQTLVVGETGLTATFATALTTVGPKGWVDLHLVALRPVLEAMATTLGDAMQAGRRRRPEPMPTTSPMPGLEDTPFAAMAGMPGMGNMMSMLAPALLGVQAGSMIGYLAQHALGRYDLPLPTGPTRRPSASSSPTSTPSRRRGRCRATTCASTSRCTRPCTRRRARCRGCASASSPGDEYVSSYEIDPSAFEAEFGMIDPQDPESMQRLTESPERVLGAMQSPRQAAPREELQRLTVGDRGLRRPRARAASVTA